MKQVFDNTIRRFLGMDQHSVPNAVPPTRALDLLNVIPASTGGLEKMRLPTALTAAVAGVGTGPYTMWNYQTANPLNMIIANFDSKIYQFDILNGYAATLIEDSANNRGSWSWVTSNNIAFGANATVMRKYLGPTGQWWPWGGSAGAAPTVTSTATAGALTFTNGGRSYKQSYRNSTTGHIVTASVASAYTGNITAKQVNVQGVASTDAQFDQWVWWATEDGGGDYFFHSYTAAGTNLVDNLADDSLDDTRRAPLINDAPPVVRYLAYWQGRIFGFAVIGAETDIVYSGYEQILEGRPEESFPPGNRLRLAIGADIIRGGGVLQNGVVAWSRSNEMYMFKGQVEDVSTDLPVQFSAFLEHLPWQEGLYSHWSIQSTAVGLVYLASDLNFKIFDGVKPPFSISDSIYPLLRRITPGMETSVQSVYYSWGDRKWYAALIPIDGAVQPNMLVFFDLSTGKDNVGCFTASVNADSIAMAEDNYGRPKMLLGANGLVYELNVVSDTTNGITKPDDRHGSAGVLQARWRSGWYGEGGGKDMIFRAGRLMADQQGFQVRAYLVDPEQGYNFQNPYITPVQRVRPDGRFAIDRVAEYCSIEVIFPLNDYSVNLLSLHLDLEPVADL